MSLEAGTLLGPYEILGPLAAGGMGEVYRARDTRLEQATRRGWIHYPFLADRDRALDNLHGDPRFATLLQRVHAEWTDFRARFG